MSQTFTLVCHHTQQCLWVGQGSYGGGMTTFYSGVPDVMDRLGRFLEATRGFPVILLTTDESCHFDYEEFEESPDSDD